MKKRPVEPILWRQYRRLEKDEKKLRADLAVLYKVHEGRISNVITNTYNFVAIDGKPKHAMLMRRIPSQEAALLKQQIKRLNPAAPLKFDNINRLDATRLGLTIAELELAAEEERLIISHLRHNVEECWNAFEDWLDYYNVAMTTAVISAIVKDKRYPIHETIIKNHRNLAENTTKRLEEVIVRGMPMKDAIPFVSEYVTRREQHGSDTLLYYEGTRTTVDTLEEVVKDIADYFRTVCIHDGKTCEKCKDIEKEQEFEPVPIDDFEAGVTAPPFHPYCRCGIEVIFHDDD